MTITELTKIIVETIVATEDDILHYRDLASELVNITIQVMETLKGVTLDMSTRDLKHALLVQKIVRKVKENETLMPQKEAQPALFPEYSSDWLE